MCVGLITKLSLNLPWLRRSGIRCLAHTSNEPGFPVRYIPKKHRDVNHTQNSSSNGLQNPNVLAADNLSDIRSHLNQDRFHGRGITEHVRFCGEEFEELQVDNGNSRCQEHECNQNTSSSNEVLRSNTMKYPRVGAEELPISNAGNQARFFELDNVSYHDGAIDADCLDVTEEVEEMNDYGGSDVQKQGRMKTSRTKKDAEKLAIELLAKRAFTAVELRKKLSGRNFPFNVVQAVIHDLQVRGMINDRLYAETFSQSRWTSSSWGPRRIKHALSKKGVNESDVENAVKLVFEDDGDDDRKSSLRLSNSAVEQLYMQACKQWQRSQNVGLETRKARVIRWLQYRGFDWSVVSFILKKLESQNPV